MYPLCILFVSWWKRYSLNTYNSSQGNMINTLKSKKHKLGVIERNIFYVDLLRAIIMTNGKPKEIANYLGYKRWTSGLSQKLENIRGKNYNWVISNGELKKDLIRYELDYKGIIQYMIDKFFKKYKGLSYVLLNSEVIIKKLKYYLGIRLIEENYKGNCYNLFEQFIVENYLYENTKFIKMDYILEEFKKQDKIKFQNRIKELNQMLELNFPKLKDEDQLSIVGDNMFFLLCRFYCMDKLRN